MVGIGPGGKEELTPIALSYLQQCTVIIGYKTYIDLVKSLIGEKKVVAYGMKEEQARALEAINLALSGERVVVISGGDAGVYGMSGVVLEALKEKNISPRKVNLTIIPGITSALKAASLLGSPLNHDFCLISLSDLLTPWEVIEKRLRHAALGDFAIALYNPQSHRRKKLTKAIEILLEYKNPATPVGIVREAGRLGEEIKLKTLAEITEDDADMRTVIIIGNSQSYFYENFIITPRGYKW